MEETPLGQKEHLTFRLQASDPDFGLRQVVVHAQVGEKDLKLPSLLQRSADKEPYTGTLRGTIDFIPIEHSLRPGDVVTYWAEAADNKTPNANVTQTPKRTILIVDRGEANDPNQSRRLPIRRKSRIKTKKIRGKTVRFSTKSKMIPRRS